MQTTIFQQLEHKFKEAFIQAGLDSSTPCVLQEATRPEFGDYQVNGVMAVAKALKINPRELASKIVELVDKDEMIEKLEIAGPGFINVSLNDKYLTKILNDDILTVHLTPAQLVVVDYSSPNLAKEVHVGHLRSTVIGDALVRIFEYMGNKVLRRNHVGDWGTQFGMLTAYLFEIKRTSQEGILELSDLEDFYRKAKIRFDEDELFAAKARDYVVRLQAKEAEVLKLWEDFVRISLNHCQQVYDRLGVKLTYDDVYGESVYNDALPQIVETLLQKNVAIDSNGAICVFFKDGELDGNEESPFIIQKKDGAYLYATTDLAAVDDRVKNLQADRIVYVIDARQSLHMKQLFITSRKAGLAKANTQLEHAAFGTMMGEDGKPFKTRSGGTVKLVELIDEAILRAYNTVKQRNPEWSEEEVQKLAKILGVAAMKYADLSKHRLSDYIFNFDQMLAFEGNTAPYLLYAYTRIISIFKKAQLNINKVNLADLNLASSAEHQLALHIAKFADKLTLTAKENYPHYLCLYLYELAGLFMRFYEQCPILKSDVDEKIKLSRLALAALSAKCLKTGLKLLGITVSEQM